MNKRLAELYAGMTTQEQAELEAFAVFVIARRKLKRRQLLTDDVSVQELMKLVEKSGSFDWLNSSEEDRYSITDGETVEWS